MKDRSRFRCSFPPDAGIVRFFSQQAGLVALMLGVLPLSTQAKAPLSILPAQTIDLGSFPAETEQSAAFTLSNCTDRVIRIGDPESCCAMAEPVLYRKQIVPGSTIPLDVFIDARNLNGPFSKSVSVSIEGSTNQPVKLWIKGNAKQAIATSTPLFFAGWIPLDLPWQTNLAFSLRRNLSGKPEASLKSNIKMDARVLGPKPDGTFPLQLCIPEGQQPARWNAVVTIRITDHEKIPPLQIKLEGNIGGSLHPHPALLKLNETDSPQVSFTLTRKYPVPAPSPAPLTCSDPDVEITEIADSDGKSTVTLKLKNAFIQQLKKQKRIPLQLHADGCTPANVIIQYDQ